MRLFGGALADTPIGIEAPAFSYWFGVIETGHTDGDPDKTQEEYDNDNHADQENPNNDEYDK
jgi:hypothetical protein